MAFRDVVSHCIYGVDINPMAVELCKVALWLESIDPGKPLSFLDHRILCGNSLIGVTPRLLAEGIPDDAFKPITGDDKRVCKEFKRRNKEERTGKGGFMFDLRGEAREPARPWNRLGNLVQPFAQLAVMQDDSLEGVEAKEQRYAELVRSTAYENARLLADAWCAAFVWIKRPPERRANGERRVANSSDPLTTPHSPLTSSGFDDCITESWFRRIEANPHCLPPWMREEIARLRDQYQFFHWHLAFPDAFRVPGDGQSPENPQPGWSGGFDIVLGNPPWEKVKLQEREWFSSSRPDIANATTAARRRELVAALSTTDEPLFLAYKHALRHSEASTAFIRNSTRFEFGASGDTNTYPLFIENARLCISQHGRSGLIVKTGILADYSMRDFFADLVESNALLSAHDFSNRRLIFPGVVANERFTLLTIGARAASGDPASISILNDGVETIHDQARAWTLSGDDVRLINPNTKTSPLFQTARDAKLVTRIYRSHPILLKESASEGESPWKAQYYTMFHMSNDSGLFHDQEELQQRDATAPSPRWVVRDEEFVSVTEGKLFDQFNHRHGDFRGIPRAKRFGIKAEPNHPTPEGYRDPLRTSLPRYWVLTAEPHRRWIDRLGFVPGGAVAFRDVCRTHTDLRTVRASVVPAHGPGNKAPLLIFPGETKGEHARRSVFAVANLNAFALDYVARQKFSGGSLNRYILIQLPVCEHTIGPFSFGRQHRWFVNEGLELSYTAWDLEPFAEDCGYDGPPFRWDEERRFLIRCELDAAFFHLYGIERDDVVYIMETFPIVKRKDIARTEVKDDSGEVTQEGRYITKDTILEIYDEMAECMASGEQRVASGEAGSGEQPVASSEEGADVARTTDHSPLTTRQSPSTTDHSPLTTRRRLYQTRLNPPPGPPADAEGNFLPLPEWLPGEPRPADWPRHIHAPREVCDLAKQQGIDWRTLLEPDVGGQ